MADEMGEKTEQPTSKKLQDAREKGQIAKSQDLSGAIDLIGAALLLAVFGPALVNAFGALMKRLIADHGDTSPIGIDGLHAMILGIGGDTILALAPIIAAVVVVAAVAQFVQVGALFTTAPLEPKLERLDPIQGFKRVFGPKGLAKSILNTAKLVLVLVVGSAVIASALGQVASLPALPLVAGFRAILGLGAELAAWLLAILLVLGVADYAFQRWQHRRDLRMTKQEVKEEHRNMEGDPEMKGKRLRMAREIALQRVNSAVPTADVVVTNPTHYSVAIRYDQQKMGAPVVVAKGVDELALRIRQLARTHEVPIVERPPLARALYYGVEVGREISPEHYQAVAEILAYVYRLEGQAA